VTSGGGRAGGGAGGGLVVVLLWYRQVLSYNSSASPRVPIGKATLSTITTTTSTFTSPYTPPAAALLDDAVLGQLYRCGIAPTHNQQSQEPKKKRGV